MVTEALTTFTFPFEIKADEGSEDTKTEHRLRAVVAKMDVLDAHRDILVKGSIGKQNVALSRWHHSSAYDDPPVGRGVVEEKGDELILDATFFKTARGEESAEMVVEMADMLEYSIAFRTKDYTEGQGDDKQYIRKILKADVVEVSPVLRGAQPGTHTVSAKCDSCLAAQDSGEMGAKAAEQEGGPKPEPEPVPAVADTAKEMTNRAMGLRNFKLQEVKRNAY